MYNLDSLVLEQLLLHDFSRKNQPAKINQSKITSLLAVPPC